MDELEITKIVLDNGSNMLKIGFGGDENPEYVIPTVIGVSKNKEKTKS